MPTTRRPTMPTVMTRALQAAALAAAALTCGTMTLAATLSQRGAIHDDDLRSPAAVAAPDPETPAPPPSKRGSSPPATKPLPFKRPRTDNPTRDGTRALAEHNIAAAWFSGTIPLYRHSPFGGKEEHPNTLTVSLADRRVQRFKLPPDSVFEDRAPRIADIDGDGRDEVVVVRSYVKKGSALAVIGQRGADLAILAETPALGQPFEWLNPAGIADFDGDGKLDIAIVVKPDDAGELQVWTLRDGTFEQFPDTDDDVTNHVKGSTAQGLSAVADFDGDGVADLAIPSQNRLNLRFLTFAGGKLRELGSTVLPAPAASDFEVIEVDGLPAVKVGIAGGRTLTIVPCRAVADWRMAKGSCP